MARPKILVVDDDENIAELVSLYLNKEQMDAETAASGEEALQLLNVYSPDLILLDIMLPGIDGYEVCQRVRATNSRVPIIMLSAKGEVFDKVLGLKIGADDYIQKPFDTNELIARVQAVLRRSVVVPEVPEEEKPDFNRQGDFVEYPGLLVNLSNYTVTLNGQLVDMPPKELEILYFLASKPNQVFSRDQLLNQVWGYDYMGDSRTVDVHIKRLRTKIEDKTKNWAISTVWRIGYKFEVR